MPIQLVSGEQHKVDHVVSGSAVVAGDCIDLNGVLVIFSVDGAIGDTIGANWPDAGATYNAVKTNPTDVFAVGDDVFITAATARALTVGGDGKIGVCSKASANGDVRVEFVHERYVS